MKTRFTTIVGLLILVGSACQQDSFLDGNQEQENDNTAFNHYVPNLNINLETAKYTADLLSHSPVKNGNLLTTKKYFTLTLQDLWVSENTIGHIMFMIITLAISK